MQLHLADRGALTVSKEWQIEVLENGQLELLLSSAAHEANHGGQIDYLKGLADFQGR